MDGIFDGVKVVDFSINIAAPLCTAMMADFGAEVMKIERPKYGDDSRYFPPFMENLSIAFLWYNRGKKSVTLDLRRPQGVEVARRLVRDADVVVESFRPGTVEKLGLGYEALKELNPRLIMLSVSAFGQNGPWSQKGGYDIIAQAMSGVASLTGEKDGPPCKVGVSIADFVAGYNAFAAVAAALFHRERTGRGQYIDIALLDCLFASNEYFESALAGMPVYRNGRHHLAGAPFGIFEGNGGYIALGVLNEKLWGEVCQLMGKPELATDPRFDSIRKRHQHLDLVVSMVESWLKQFPDVEEACRALEGSGVPCSPVYDTEELVDHPQMLARQMVVDFVIPASKATSIKARGVHIKFSSAPGRIHRGPLLGEHTDEVLGRLGYSRAQIDEMRNSGLL